MHTVSVSAEIQAPAEKIWQVLDDFGNIAAFNPMVESSPITNTIPTGIGAERVCHFYDGTSIREIITDYEPGTSYKVELADFSLPLKRAAVRLSVASLDASQSQVTMQIDFEPKFGPVGWLMATVMMKPMLKSGFAKVLQGLGEHVRTGKIVGQNGVLLDPILSRA